MSCRLLLSVITVISNKYQFGSEVLQKNLFTHFMRFSSVQSYMCCLKVWPCKNRTSNGKK